jgi:hypothetical protein
LITPPIALFSVFMGKWKYSHTELLFESMRWNPMVDFIIIYVVPSPEANSTDYLRATAAQLQVTNLHIVPLSLSEWNARVKDRLGIDVNFTAEWYYKLCDYKPTLAHMFPEWVSEDKYAYWGYGDLDVIWGNFSRYSYWFQDLKIVISGWCGTTGAAAFLKNTEELRTVFKTKKMFVKLLADQAYHNLDEGGTQTDAKNVVMKGIYSFSIILRDWRMRNSYRANNNGAIPREHCFIDEGDSIKWAGPVVWNRGDLKIIHGSPDFPPGRELLFFHVRSRKLDLPTHIRDDVVLDMIQYGYLLPSWIPLLTKHKCKRAGLRENIDEYEPYAVDCYPHSAHMHAMEHRHYRPDPPSALNMTVTLRW